MPRNSFQDAPGNPPADFAIPVFNAATGLLEFKQGGTRGTVSSLPGSPVDGQVIEYLADAPNGVVWRLKYRAASASAYKWEFIGGGWLVSEVETDEGTGTTGSATYASLATAGPSITVPLAGDYEIQHGSTQYFNTASVTSHGALHSYAVGGTAAVDADSAQSKIVLFNTTTYPQLSTFNTSRSRLKTGLAASTAIVSKYKSDANAHDAHFLNRWMRTQPRRVG